MIASNLLGYSGNVLNFFIDRNVMTEKLIYGRFKHQLKLELNSKIDDLQLFVLGDFDINYFVKQVDYFFRFAVYFYKRFGKLHDENALILNIQTTLSLNTKTDVENFFKNTSATPTRQQRAPVAGIDEEENNSSSSVESEDQSTHKPIGKKKSKRKRDVSKKRNKRRKSKKSAEPLGTETVQVQTVTNTVTTLPAATEPTRDTQNEATVPLATLPTDSDLEEEFDLSLKYFNFDFTNGDNSDTDSEEEDSTENSMHEKSVVMAKTKNDKQDEPNFLYYLYIEVYGHLAKRNQFLASNVVDSIEKPLHLNAFYAMKITSKSAYIAKGLHRCPHGMMDQKSLDKVYSNCVNWNVGFQMIMGSGSLECKRLTVIHAGMPEWNEYFGDPVFDYRKIIQMILAMKTETCKANASLDDSAQPKPVKRGAMVVSLGFGNQSYFFKQNPDVKSKPRLIRLKDKFTPFYTEAADPLARLTKFKKKVRPDSYPDVYRNENCASVVSAMTKGNGEEILAEAFSFVLCEIPPKDEEGNYTLKDEHEVLRRHIDAGNDKGYGYDDTACYNMVVLFQEKYYRLSILDYSRNSCAGLVQSLRDQNFSHLVHSTVATFRERYKNSSYLNIHLKDLKTTSFIKPGIDPIPEDVLEFIQLGPSDSSFSYLSMFADAFNLWRATMKLNRDTMISKEVLWIAFFVEPIQYCSVLDVWMKSKSTDFKQHMALEFDNTLSTICVGILQSLKTRACQQPNDYTAGGWWGKGMAHFSTEECVEYMRTQFNGFVAILDKVETKMPGHQKVWNDLKKLHWMDQTALNMFYPLLVMTGYIVSQRNMQYALKAYLDISCSYMHVFKKKELYFPERPDEDESKMIQAFSAKMSHYTMPIHEPLTMEGIHHIFDVIHGKRYTRTMFFKNQRLYTIRPEITPQVPMEVADGVVTPPEVPMQLTQNKPTEFPMQVAHGVAAPPEVPMEPAQKKPTDIPMEVADRVVTPPQVPMEPAQNKPTEVPMELGDGVVTPPEMPMDPAENKPTEVSMEMAGKKKTKKRTFHAIIAFMSNHMKILNGRSLIGLSLSKSLFDKPLTLFLHCMINFKLPPVIHNIN